MSVWDFVNLCIEPSMLKVEIYSVDLGETVYMGTGDDIPYEIQDEEVSSFDVPTIIDTITINIH